MRPVNLIPPEDRRGDRAPLRAGSLSYVVTAVFAVILLAVLGLVTTQNSITERENEIGELEVARDAATKQAEALAPYAEFASLQVQREATITSLAQSRFDWERVLRELALVIPSDVSLDSLDATTAGAPDQATTTVAAPSLLISGCARSHEVVAEFVAALEDIDGVTRVGLDNSSKAGDDAGGGGSAASVSDRCTAKGVVSFSLQAVFDHAVPTTPVPTASPPSASVPAGANTAPEQVGEANKAANLVPGVAR